MTIWLFPRMRLAPEGLVFVLPLAGVTLLTVLGSWWGATVLGGVLTVGVAWFFRDPERHIPQTPGAVVSPADGRVMEIAHEDASRQRISIFLSPLDVHINRAPYGGTIRTVVYTPGQFVAAYRPEASRVNEANAVTIAAEGQEFVVKQIAGVLARRIVCRVQPGERLEKGQRYGLIRFGSRTDLLLPAAAELAVHVGDVVRGGETILAFLKEPPGA
ncbi:MAG: phosphatidylserine decarboxylase family protein [Candidatus Tectomicrobia bacterium]|uniref:Phosphatidylserine decarboxylase proenzyme n=1 Tax=Tectimicrobiota bacterium TaxID=2528274 RepID=A0A938B191_UNCTE|nr:phosphatidylserine decarboxylase family protein [Candidatus Tectomicrobia bacterium]